MENTEQAQGVSVAEHGRRVLVSYETLLDCMRGLRPPLDRLPGWVVHHRGLLMQRLLPIHVMREYLLLHDCGKPYCRVVDSENRVHFPGHAAVSAEVYRRAWGGGASPLVQELIRRDMEIHTISADALKDLSRDPLVASLLVAGLAEVYANAVQFGGANSQSFKIKMNHLDRRGRALCRLMAEEVAASR